MDELIKDRVKVVWSALGEGLCGDYQADDPEDVELLRFDVYWKNDAGEWTDPGDVSYCTQVPVTATPTLREAGLNLIMDEVYEVMMSNEGYGAKKICERLSWTDIETIRKDAHAKLIEPQGRSLV